MLVKLLTCVVLSNVWVFFVSVSFVQCINVFRCFLSFYLLLLFSHHYQSLHIPSQLIPVLSPWQFSFSPAPSSHVASLASRAPSAQVDSRAGRAYSNFERDFFKNKFESLWCFVFLISGSFSEHVIEIDRVVLKCVCRDFCFFFSLLRDSCDTNWMVSWYKCAVLFWCGVFFMFQIGCGVNSDGIFEENVDLNQRYGIKKGWCNLTLIAVVFDEGKNITRKPAEFANTSILWFVGSI